MTLNNSTLSGVYGEGCIQIADNAHENCTVNVRGYSMGRVMDSASRFFTGLGVPITIGFRVSSSRELSHRLTQ